MEKLDGKSFDVIGDNISKLKEIFPEVVNGDNQIDFDNLRDILEKDVEVVDDENHYQFTWWGKKGAKRKALESTTKTLRPYKKDSENWDTTENIYIEGDNLDALKILLGSYRNRIKMIYIDPPYNTGHDFIYHDNRAETEREHLESTGQLNEEGQLLENPKTEGKYHSNWLNMMYPRLYLAKKLLKDDGVLVISIDENEIKNLLEICSEIFGEDNIDTAIWQKVDNDSGKMKITYRMRLEHEYVIFCYKNKSHSFFNKFIEARNYKNEYTNPDNDPRGPYKQAIISNTEENSNKNSKTFYDVTTPSGKVYSRQWRVEKWEMDELIADNRIYFGKNGDSVPSLKAFINEPKLSTPATLFSNVGTAKTAGKMIEDVMGDRKIFSYPKPTELIDHLIRIVTDSRFSLNPEKSSKRKVFFPGADMGINVENEGEIILDFFSGSATTAHSILNVNSEDNLKRKFIMVQLPEETDEKSEAYKAGYENICEIGKERIRRAGMAILEESDNKDLDIGFKVFKIDDSNFIPWNPQIKTEEEVEQAILGTANNLVQGRSELDLVYELLLQLNLDLNAKIEEKQINNHKFYVVNNGFLLICLQPTIDDSLAKDIINLRDELMTEYCKVILLDKALNSNSSINIYNDLNSENIELDTI